MRKLKLSILYGLMIFLPTLVKAEELGGNKESHSIFFLRYLVDLAIKNGVPSRLILLLLLLPLIAFIVAFLRQVIGVKTLGIYVPSILTIVFLETKLFYGLLFFLVVFALGTLFHYLFKKRRLLYFPKMAIILGLISFSIILILALMPWPNLIEVTTLSVLVIFMIIVLMEEFIDIQIKRGLRESIYLLLGTLGASILSYFIGSWQMLQTFFLRYPEIILVILIIDYLLGKWSGLRLYEYYRFRKGLKHVSTTK